MPTCLALKRPATNATFVARKGSGDTSELQKSPILRGFKTHQEQPDLLHPTSPEEPLFRNAQLARQLPSEARKVLAEHLVQQQAALWADEAAKDWRRRDRVAVRVRRGRVIGGHT